MFLMWLGSMVILFSGLWISQEALRKLLVPLRERSLDALNSKKFSEKLRGALLYSLGSASEQEPSELAAVGYNYRLLERRGALLLACMSLLGLWWPLALSWSYMQYNGLLLLGAAGIFWMLPWARNTASRRPMMIQFFFGLGLFYFGSELMMKNSSLLINILGQSELAFLLPERSVAVLAGLWLAGALLASLIKVEFCTVILAIILMLSGSVSFLGGLFLFFGERTSKILFSLRFINKINQSVKTALIQRALSSAIGLFIGAFIVVSVAQSSEWGRIYGVEVQVRNQQLMACVAVVLFFQFIGTMAWGHFASLKLDDEIQEVRYVAWSTVKAQMSGLAKDWISLGLGVRLKAIRGHIKDSEALGARGIPEALKHRLLAEEEQIAGIIEDL